MAWMKTVQGLGRLPMLLAAGRFHYTFDGMPLRAEGIPWRKRLNLAACGADLALGRSNLLGLPPAMQVEPTNLCNLKCPLCPTGTGTLPRKQGMMSMETFRRVLEQAGESLVGIVLYSWGEPFLNPDLPRMIADCSERGIMSVTSTNGHCLQTPEEARRVVDAGLRALVVALDGSTQEIYTAYRKHGDVEKVKRCAGLIEEAKARAGSPYPYTNLRVVATRENEADIPNLRELARRMGMNMFSIKSVGCLTSSPAYEGFEASEETLQRYDHRDGVRIERQSVHCPYPFRQPTIFWDGTVVGCEFDYGTEVAWGNIHERPLREIWNCERALSLRRAIRSESHRPHFCDLCPYRGRNSRSTVLSCEELKALRS